MVITIYEGYNKGYILLGCRDECFREEFHKHWGSVVNVPTSAIYTDLSQIAHWCNDTFGEECLFEID